MNIKYRMILDDFKRERPNFLELEQVAAQRLKYAIKDSGVLITGIEHRVKSEKSLEGKLYKKGDYYQRLNDLTDLLGLRVICYFGDDVDKVGQLVEKIFPTS